VIAVLVGLGALSALRARHASPAPAVAG
jgi:hypothetical protein